MKKAVVVVALVLSAGCGPDVDKVLCGSDDCAFSGEEWRQLQALANLPEAPPNDPSNKYAQNPKAQALGQQLYFDPRFSGTATLLDTLRRPTPYARAPKGQPLNISCATCHDPARAGADFTSNPNHVSIGGGWYDVNSQQTVNSAYYGIIYWNGRNDSLWSQIVAVSESFVSMASNRLKILWLMNEKYAAAYAGVFTAFPLPFNGTLAETAARVDAVGQCTKVAGVCPAPCRNATSTDGASSCWPRFPLEGRPGSLPGCQAGSTTEPFGDAFDCMDADDQHTITGAYVNWSKAIAAYEQTLVSRDSTFDRWVNEGAQSTLFTAEQKRGARVFVGKGSCIDCHNTPLMSDSQFHNVGVPQLGAAVPTEADCHEGSVCDCVNGKNCLPAGGLDGLAKLRANGFRRDSMWSDSPTDTSRRAYLELPLGESLRGTWRTPSLRDVELTAPYMHDGAYATLEDVVWMYDRGGSNSNVPGKKSVQVRPLHLTALEQADLVSFLRTLTGAPQPSSRITAPVLPP